MKWTRHSEEQIIAILKQGEDEMHQSRSVHQSNMNASDAIGAGSLSMTCATMPSAVSRRMAQKQGM